MSLSPTIDSAPLYSLLNHIPKRHVHVLTPPDHNPCLAWLESLLVVPALPTDEAMQLHSEGAHIDQIEQHCDNAQRQVLLYHCLWFACLTELQMGIKPW